MTEIEKMKRYIELSKITNSDSYQMSTMEMLDLAYAAAETPIEMIILAFNYGRAKGYRAAKAKMKEAIT